MENTPPSESSNSSSTTKPTYAANIREPLSVSPILPQSGPPTRLPTGAIIEKEQTLPLEQERKQTLTDNSMFMITNTSSVYSTIKREETPSIEDTVRQVRVPEQGASTIDQQSVMNKDAAALNDAVSVEFAVKRNILEEEKALKQLDCYHGFLPREELNILQKEGDYLIRVTDVDTNPKNIRREIILSVFPEETSLGSRKEKAGNMQKEKIRNIIISWTSNNYTVEQGVEFPTVAALIEYYKKNHCEIRGAKRFILKTPIGLQNWELLHHNIQLGRVLGEGAFGSVLAGKLTLADKQIDVAIKMTKNQSEQTKAKLCEMMKEARITRSMKHVNVVRTYGVAVDEQPIYLVLELVKGGALNSHLKKMREQSNIVPVKEKIEMCIGAAEGLKYLHKSNVIHRDIAARNCLYDEQKVVKISDFGLSKVASSYKMKTSVRLPIKWLAPETLNSLMFSTKTDVFSYGVMMYEVFSDGGDPWADVSNALAKQQVKIGNFLQMPPSCPEKLRQFIYERIFVLLPEKRAGFIEIAKFLRSINPADLQTEKTEQQQARMKRWTERGKKLG